MATAAVRAKRAKAVEKANNLFKGSSEPFVSEETYRSDLVKALNYYNIEDDKLLRKNLLAYYKKKDPILCTLFSKASDIEVHHVAVITRLIEREQHVAEKELSYLQTTIQKLSKKYNVAVTPVKAVVAKAPTVVVSIEERILGAAQKHAAEINNEIDQFTKNKTSTFSTKNYLLKNSVSGVVSKRIGDFYKPLQKELTEAVSGKDDQLKEGWSNFTKTQLKKFLVFVEGIILDCQQMVADSKVRKPRTVKKKPAGVLVAKMKYQVKNDDFKLKSFNPADIIGSTEVWVFNTKYITRFAFR